MGMNYYAVKKKPTISEPIHIGKSSAGWKFLFHEINKWDLSIRTFPQWKEWLEKNVGIEEDKDYVILNEEDEIVSLKEFLKNVEEKQKIENPDNFTTAKNIDGYRFSDGEFS